MRGNAEREDAVSTERPGERVPLEQFKETRVENEENEI